MTVLRFACRGKEGKTDIKRARLVFEKLAKFREKFQKIIRSP